MKPLFDFQLNVLSGKMFLRRGITINVGDEKIKSIQLEYISIKILPGVYVNSIPTVMGTGECGHRQLGRSA